MKILSTILKERETTDRQLHTLSATYVHLVPPPSIIFEDNEILVYL